MNPLHMSSLWSRLFILWYVFFFCYCSTIFIQVYFIAVVPLFRKLHSLSLFVILHYEIIGILFCFCYSGYLADSFRESSTSCFEKCKPCFWFLAIYPFISSHSVIPTVSSSDSAFFLSFKIFNTCRFSLFLYKLQTLMSCWFFICLFIYLNVYSFSFHVTGTFASAFSF